MRIDKLLFFLRLARTRSIAQGLAGAGHIRIAGRRIERASHAVAIGDVVTLPLGASVLSFELLALPVRRGPPTEAQTCYRSIDATARQECQTDARPLDDGGAFAIAAPSNTEEPTGAMGSPQQ